MSDTPFRISDTPAGQMRPPRWRPRVKWLLAVGALAVLAIVAAALIPTLGGSGSRQPFSVQRVAKDGDGASRLPEHVSTVFGSTIPAAKYGTRIADLEGKGVDHNGQLASDLSPIPPSEFNAPIAAYRVYAEQWAARLAGELPELQRALASGSRGASEQAWSTAYSDYLHLGAVYGLLPGTIDGQIDGLPEAMPAPGQPENFPGLHRIEMGLWTGAPTQSLVPVAAALQRQVVKLRAALATVQIDPLDYTLRAHEILEDAQRDFMSGTDVPWSGAGVLGTAAGIAATEEVIGTLTPLLQGRDNTLGLVQSWLIALQSAFDNVRRAYHGTWPSLTQLTVAQREQLDGVLAGTLGALSLVPGTLETTPVPVIPSIPGHG